VEVGVFFRFEDFVEDYAEAAPEEIAGGDGEGGEEKLLDEREVLGFGKSRKRKKHRRTELQPHDTGWGVGLSRGL
jgi:hypothetical protein